MYEHETRDYRRYRAEGYTASASYNAIKNKRELREALNTWGIDFHFESDYDYDPIDDDVDWPEGQEFWGIVVTRDGEVEDSLWGMDSDDERNLYVLDTAVDMVRGVVERLVKEANRGTMIIDAA